MIPALLLGGILGLGLWLVVIAIRPRPAPLGYLLAALAQPPPPPVGGGPGGRPTAWMLRLLSILGAHTPQRARQLALAGHSPEGWARDKLLAVIAGLGGALLVGAGLAAAGLRLPGVVAALAVLAAGAGWMIADLRLKEQVHRRRKAFRHALSAYLDLVNVILAGGAGIETALLAAAEAGEGWAFARLRQSLHQARRINQPLWAAFQKLGVELGISELADLASSLRLAGSHGARIRATLAVKADTLRAHQLAETEQAAEATTERMNLPTAVLLLGFLVFIIFPAVTAITATTSPACAPGSPAAAAGCPQSSPSPARSTP